MRAPLSSPKTWSSVLFRKARVCPGQPKRCTSESCSLLHSVANFCFCCRPQFQFFTCDRIPRTKKPMLPKDNFTYVFVLNFHIVDVPCITLLTLQSASLFAAPHPAWRAHFRPAFCGSLTPPALLLARLLPCS